MGEPKALARISHHLATAVADVGRLLRRAPCGLLDVLSKYAYVALGRTPRIRLHLRHLATRRGEKCGLAFLPFFITSSLLLLWAAPEPAQSASKDFWEGTLEEARETAAGDGRPIILYFPPARPSEIPEALRDPASLEKASRRFHLARVRAYEVEALLLEFRLKAVPAVLLLDRQGGTAERWEETIPQDFWLELERAARRLQKAEEELARALLLARSALDRENFSGALASARDAVARARPGYPERAAALKIESAVLARAETELKKALARDGISSDQELLMELRRLRERFPHPLLAERVSREVERIRTRPVGGEKREDSKAPTTFQASGAAPGERE